MNHPAVVVANHFKFRRDSDIKHPLVQSRMLLWCKEGRGEVIINTLKYPLSKSSFLFLPWDHSIEYIPDITNPFVIGGIHLIPNYAPDAQFIFEVAHNPQSGLFNKPERSDCDFGIGYNLIQGSLLRYESLELLAEYIICCFQRHQCHPEFARKLGYILIEELKAFDTVEDASLEIPPCMVDILAAIDSHLGENLKVNDISSMYGCSPTTLTRRFHKYLNTTPMEWVIRRRMEYARKLITTTDLKLMDVAHLVGIDDPYYFSKLFKKHWGMPPSQYRATAVILY